MKKLILLIIPFLLLSSCTQEKAEDNNYFQVNRGINIAHWLSQSSRRGEERLNFFTKKDVQTIASLGFDHIRLPIDEEQMFTLDGTPEPEAFQLLHNAIDWSLESGLKVVVDLHILRSHHFNAESKPLFTDRNCQLTFFDCWKKLSASLKDYSVKDVAYELLNEPVADTSEDWNVLINECYDVVRALEPERKIIMGSNLWQDFSCVKDLRVNKEDKNIIISFHYYAPYLLTHYTAPWTVQKHYRGPVHYPGMVCPRVEYDFYCPDEYMDTFSYVYGQYYDRNVILSNFKEAADVAADLGLQVYCGEYGCIGYAPREDRIRYLTDVNWALDQLGVGRAMWSYGESSTTGFGMMTENGADPELAKALGLAVPQER